MTMKEQVQEYNDLAIQEKKAQMGLKIEYQKLAMTLQECKLQLRTEQTNVVLAKEQLEFKSQNRLHSQSEKVKIAIVNQA